MKLSILMLAACFTNGVPARAQSVLDPSVWEQSEKLGADIRGIKVLAQADRASRPESAALTLPFTPSVPFKIRTQMSGDMEFVSAIRAEEASGLHRNIFGSVDGRDYLRFFSDRIESIDMGSCGDSIGAVACVYGWNSSKMWLAKGYALLNIPQISRIGIVFHEARHTEDAHDNWPHALCPTPFKDESGNDVRGIFSGVLLAGKEGCDTTPFGAYGTGLVMLKNISKYCVNCTDKVRMDAGLYADDLLRRIIDPAAVKTIQDDLYR
ncbi:MAG TPA: hypothetical protein DCZ01_01635 [Elusimicrobia bacterium]|nr:MAG: hypothetical protein A2X37_07285 [Elusimicrobia bacterium GWA2_66_18]OGR76697.1 MAG: hypothetical protein A2X40_02070 [Elusimicrobia bacterium GWC2_65_9]HAZ07231.1 hypothetical protein [Elusimicrobiota bacterium]